MSPSYIYQLIKLFQIAAGGWALLEIGQFPKNGVIRGNTVLVDERQFIFSLLISFQKYRN